MGPLDKQVLRSDSLAVTADGFDLSIYMFWYRALPLTSIAQLDLWVDGRRVTSEGIETTLNDVRRPLAELTEQTAEYWFPTDPLVLHITDPSAAESTEHRVRLDLGLSIPYILIGPQQTPLVAVASNDRPVTAGTAMKEHA